MYIIHQVFYYFRQIIGRDTCVPGKEKVVLLLIINNNYYSNSVVSIFPHIVYTIHNTNNTITSARPSKNRKFNNNYKGCSKKYLYY